MKGNHNTSGSELSLTLVPRSPSRENGEIKRNQARMSVEVNREVSSDKSLKSKAEKERRLREKHSNNTKLFIDERKTAAMRQEKRREKLKKIHENQMTELTKYVQNVSFSS